MKSIKAKLLTYFGTLLICGCIILGIIAYASSNYILGKNTKELLTETATQSAKLVTNRLDSKKAILETIAQRDDIRDMNIPFEKKAAILKSEVSRTGFSSMGIGNLNGEVNTFDGGHAVIKDRPYYQEALKGKSVVSDPIKSKTDGKLIINVAVPINDKDGKQVGVLLGATNAAELSSITNDIIVGKSGKAFIINKAGVTVANYNKDSVEKGENVIEEAKKDSSIQGLANIQKEMIKGGIGASEYMYQGQHKYIAYAPINSTGWSIGINVLQSEILSELSTLRLFIALGSIIIIIIGVLLAYFVSKAIANKVTSISSHLKLLAKGDFSVKIPEKFLNSKDEIGDALRSLAKMHDDLVALIKELIGKSKEMSSSSEELYGTVKELTRKAESIEKAVNDIADGVHETSAVSEEISASIEEVDSSINELSEKAAEGTNNANGAKERATEVRNNSEAAIREVRKMSAEKENNMMKAMEEGKVVENIKSMADTIASIAEQTNLLALNAAIEAARAGEQGKGFAVVSEEIRELAEQSAEAVKSIQETIVKVQGAFKNSTDTGKEVLEFINKDLYEQFDAYAKTGNQYYDDSDFVSKMSEEIAAMSEEITATVGQVSNAVQNMAETAQKSNEKSETIKTNVYDTTKAIEQVALTAQVQSELAQKLNEMVEKFKI
ncbi:chemotaxis protein [Clostridium carboxidivorans P7]|uniref:Methyl-accepting chemotaxis sensory transducer with Cache sensor n=1 Tax=Clostridium carboxidivorans P7 TaxID=536227 RepID=C6PYK2_9CLOT|nr:methyl-accepting chemotaxis protein [Clostridium carboxidivorans]AKN29670.1 chemotaxis protein [Clostridium carboxidivorans P7]EET85682.1 methyl-accepting chemotaxis sensory transducer with Cache sensor [Clostridium carboxidivorans P7]EFG89398.1 methyl-accepting chemotaxis protein signaling domain protein [Clostridium carboxidivorans P7]